MTTNTAATRINFNNVSNIDYKCDDNKIINGEVLCEKDDRILISFAALPWFSTHPMEQRQAWITVPNNRIISVVTTDNPTNKIIIKKLQKQEHDDDNDGIDISKYGKTAKEKKHDPNSNDDMHELREDLKKLGLMAQNKTDPENPMDKVRIKLYDIFVGIGNDGDNDDGLYKDIIDLILEYEAYINLSKFKCIECGLYFGCDVFDNLCSNCYGNKYDVLNMKIKCKENLESIPVRIEWDDKIEKVRYYNIISMPSLCSIKIYFRILNRNSYHTKCLDVFDENYLKMYTIQKYDPFKKSEDEEDDEEDEEIKKKRKLNERCVTDFGIISLSAILKH